MFNFSRISSHIKANEGFRRCVYKDKFGNPTIGYGHLIRSKENFSLKRKYSKKVLLELFYVDLKKAILDFKKNFAYNNLSDSEQEIIIEMIFQLGIEKVLKFKKFYYQIYIHQVLYLLCYVLRLKENQFGLHHSQFH